MNIVPTPNKISLHEGELLIENSIKTEGEGNCPFSAKIIYDALQSVIPSISHSDTSTISIVYDIDRSLLEDAYRLEILDNSINIFSNSNGGFIYAAATLKQLIFNANNSDGKSISLQCATIDDEPMYKWRGFMLDESRHFFGINEVKRLLSLMALHKLNVFHWHLSDDQGYRLESKAFPLLTTLSSIRSDTQLDNTKSDCFCGVEYSGLYTIEQAKEIVEYAKELNIDVVPELDMPGHFTAILCAYSELSCTSEKVPVATTFGVLHNIACPSNDKLYEFCYKLIDEWCEIFPSKYFHIGGDEVPLDKWKACPRCQNLMKQEGMTNARQLQHYFTKKIISYLNSKGKTVIGWNEFLNDDLPENVIGQYWTPNVDPNVEKHLERGRKFIMSQLKSMYFDQPYALIPLRKTYNYNPYATFKNARSNILGIEAPLWTEWIYDRRKIDVNLFPRFAALSEVCWTKPENKSYRDFRKRLPVYNKFLSNYNIDYAKNKISMPSNLLTRLNILVYWLSKDKYIEVRKNKEV